MTYTSLLWLFFVLVFGIVVLPGLDMAFILGSALARGSRHGLAAVGGVMLGAVFHTLMAAAGVGLLLQWWPAAFNLLLFAGTAYVAWIGYGIFRHAGAMRLAAGEAVTSVRQTFLRALLTNLANPKAYLFSLAVLPQFMRSEFGPLPLQVSILTLIIVATQAGVYGALVFAAAPVRAWIGTRPHAGAIVGHSVGMVLMVAALLTGLHGWQQL